jgi:hypothetical protein
LFLIASPVVGGVNTALAGWAAPAVFYLHLFLAGERSRTMPSPPFRATGGRFCPAIGGSINGQKRQGRQEAVSRNTFCFLPFTFSYGSHFHSYYISVCFKLHVRILWRKLLKGLFLTKNTDNNSTNGRICSDEQ